MSRSVEDLAERSLAGHAADGQHPRFLRAEYNTSREDFLLLGRASRRGQRSGGGHTRGGTVHLRAGGLQVVGDADGNLPRLEEQSGLDEERGLVVQEVFPPV